MKLGDWYDGLCSRLGQRTVDGAGGAGSRADRFLRTVDPGQRRSSCRIWRIVVAGPGQDQDPRRQRCGAEIRRKRLPVGQDPRGCSRRIGRGFDGSQWSWSGYGRPDPLFHIQVFNIKKKKLDLFEFLFIFFIEF